MTVWFVVVDSADKLWLFPPMLEHLPWGMYTNKSVKVDQDFELLETCPASSDPGWNTRTKLGVGKTYALWGNRTGSWSTFSSFAKARVEAIDGKEVTLKLTVQPMGGLRWVRGSEHEEE